jgi:hypothetical protein
LGRRAAVIYNRIVTASMNDIDPQAWLADVLARIAEYPVHRLDCFPGIGATETSKSIRHRLHSSQLVLRSAPSHGGRVG